MKNSLDLRSVVLYIDILNASADPRNSSIPEHIRSDIKNIALELINDLYDRSVLDYVAHTELFSQISIAYVNGGL